MKIRLLAAIAVASLTALAANAQPTPAPSPDSIPVSAQNVGAFVFNITTASYNFGQISSLGGSNVGGTEALTGVAGVSSATFTSTPTAVAFNVASAPPRTVYFYNSSPAQTLSWGAADDLRVQVVPGLAGTNCAFVGVGTTGTGSSSSCASATLHYGLAGVGRGVNSVNGNLQFEVTVDDTDLTGTNTWTVQITAAAP